MSTYFRIYCKTCDKIEKSIDVTYGGERYNMLAKLVHLYEMYDNMETDLYVDFVVEGFGNVNEALCFLSKHKKHEVYSVSEYGWEYGEQQDRGKEPWYNVRILGIVDKSQTNEQKSST